MSATGTWVGGAGKAINSPSHHTIAGGLRYSRVLYFCAECPPDGSLICVSVVLICEPLSPDQGCPLFVISWLTSSRHGSRGAGDPRLCTTSARLHRTHSLPHSQGASRYCAQSCKPAYRLVTSVRLITRILFFQNRFLKLPFPTFCSHGQRTGSTGSNQNKVLLVIPPFPQLVPHFM